MNKKNDINRPNVNNKKNSKKKGKEKKLKKHYNHEFGMHVIIFFLNTMFQGAPMCFLHEK
jgi:hypothetical protein